MWTASDRATDAITGSQSPPATASTAARSGWAAGRRRRCLTCSTAASEASAPNRKWIARLHVAVWTAEGLALCGCRRRSLLSPGRWLVDEHSNDGAVRHRCPGDGDLATRQARCAAASLRSWQPVYQRAVPVKADGRPGRRLLDAEPLRQRLGQCGDGELLLIAEDRTDSPAKLIGHVTKPRLTCSDYIECFYNPETPALGTIGYLRSRGVRKCRRD